MHSPHLPLNGIAVTEPDVSVVLIRANPIQAYHQRNLYQDETSHETLLTIQWLRNLLII